MNDPLPPTLCDSDAVTLTAAPPGWRVWSARFDPGDVAPQVQWVPLVGWRMDGRGQVAPVACDAIEAEHGDPRADVGFLAITGPGQRIRDVIVLAAHGWHARNGDGMNVTAAASSFEVAEFLDGIR